MNFATRYALHIAALAVLALIPVSIHSYAGVEIDDCRNPRALTPPPPETAAAEKRAAFMQRHFHATRFREGEIRTRRFGDIAPIRYSIVRSFDAKRLYYRPVHVLSSGFQISRSKFAWEEARGERLPVQQTFFRKDSVVEPDRVTLHMLVYEGELVEDPYRTQLVAAPRLMVQGRRPMTLYYVEFFSTPSNYEASRAAAVDWLASSWQNYQALCS